VIFPVYFTAGTSWYFRKPKGLETLLFKILAGASALAATLWIVDAVLSPAVTYRHTSFFVGMFLGIWAIGK